ncbi:hypothetical protein DFH09DRAFT_1319720 [Mycena vulgaris]|nr:hypothetical protein DFH09DRAFT_1319720 [Mycena vulgaris]
MDSADAGCGAGEGSIAIQVGNRRRPIELVPVIARQRYATAEDERLNMDTVARLPFCVVLTRCSCVTPTPNVPELHPLATADRASPHPASASPPRNNIAPRAASPPSILPQTLPVSDTPAVGGLSGESSCAEDGQCRKALSGTAARVHDAGDDCGSWSRDVGLEASRPIEGKRGVRDFRPTEGAQERRPGRESEADGDEPQSRVNPNARIDPAVRGSQAHPLPTRLLSIYTSLGLSKSKDPLPHPSTLPPPTRTHRGEKPHPSCRSGVEARDALLELGVSS